MFFGIGPAELSLATNKVATEKASQKNAKDFAGFELAEAIAVTSVLKDLGTPVPPMDAKATAMLEKMKNTSSENEFDNRRTGQHLIEYFFNADAIVIVVYFTESLRLTILVVIS